MVKEVAVIDIKLTISFSFVRKCSDCGQKFHVWRSWKHIFLKMPISCSLKHIRATDYFCSPPKIKPIKSCEANAAITSWTIYSNSGCQCCMVHQPQMMIIINNNLFGSVNKRDIIYYYGLLGNSSFYDYYITTDIFSVFFSFARIQMSKMNVKAADEQIYTNSKTISTIKVASSYGHLPCIALSRCKIKWQSCKII